MFFMKIIYTSVKLMWAFESPKLHLYSSSYGKFFLDYHMLLCFDPIHCPDFGKNFSLGKIGNLS